MSPSRTASSVLRILYILALVAGGATFLFPSLGAFDWLSEAFGGPEAAIRWSVGFLFLSMLLLYLRGSLLRRDQSLIAKRLLQLSPDVRHLDAVRILIAALESSKESVVEHAHRELIRLTGQPFGKDPQLWQGWLKRQESK